ncbi:MAG: YhbY family RNA-binding protein [Pseudomonadota bacterium]
MELTERQRKTLRGLGHPLKPVVMIADKGLSDNVAHEIEQALAFHELIKISIRAERKDRDEMIGTISQRFTATLVQRTGNIALFFRRNAERPKVVLGSR